MVDTSKQKYFFTISLILNKENEGDLSTTFLDLNIQIKGKIITTKTYDKLDDFNFEIVNYPDI